MNVEAIILAAGCSTRMGEENKMLSPLGKKSILEQSLLNLSKAKVSKIILVVGHDAEKIYKLSLIEKLNKEGRLELAFNENYLDGMGASLALGVKYLKTETSACLIALGDMPFIKPSTMNQLIDAAAANRDKQIFMPQFNGQTGHPVLWKKAFFSKLGLLAGDNGGKNIIKANKTLSQIVAVDDAGVLKDIDTPEMLGA